MQALVIIGSGLAGYTLLKEFRKRDTTTPATLVTADDGAFYSKPNLSNALAAGKTADELAGATADKLAAELNATILTHTRVTAVDTAARRVTIGAGTTGSGPIEPGPVESGTIDYGRLVLALGADPIPHGLGGDGAASVLSVNDRADYATFRRALEGSRRVTVLGGGLIGCEFANDLAHAGLAVDVVHLGAWPLERLMPAEAGQRLADALAGLGVTWHFGRRAVGVGFGDDGYTVTLDDGEILAADVVLSAIGLAPRTQLAKAAGVATARGIVTNALLETSAPDVYALGDCAEVDGRNLPYVMPLMTQARALAATLAGTPTPVVYPPMPVIVKTPAHPVAVLPPQLGAVGGWQVECSDSGVCALHVNENGELQGFALTGSETGRRASLVKSLAVELGVMPARS